MQKNEGIFKTTRIRVRLFRKQLLNYKLKLFLANYLSQFKKELIFQKIS